MVVGLAFAMVISACASPAPTPSGSTAAASVPLAAATPTTTPTRTDTPAPTPTRSPTAADLPMIDAAAVFGPTAKLTGSEDTLPGQVARGAVLALTSGHFAFAVECVGDGALTVSVTRPIDPPDADGSTYKVIASSSTMCPTSTLETFESHPVDPGPKTSLNIGAEDPPAGVYWRVILVDLGPGTSS